MSSLLYVPCGDARKLHRACDLPVHGVILDLEDAIAFDRKADAREQLGVCVEALIASGRVPYLRINAIATEFWKDDVAAALDAGVEFLFVPKIESTEELRKLDRFIQKQRAPSLRYGLLIESAAALLRLEKLARGSDRIAHLGIGFADVCADLGLTWESAIGTQPTLFTEWRTRLAIVSHAFGLEPPWDSAWLRIGDDEGMRADTLIGRRLGCVGKTAIHPSQIAIINDVYAPTPSEIEHAKAIVEAYEEASSDGTGATAREGLMIDAPVVAAARKLLEKSARSSAT
jgi:citrate lyase subunit beta / citryl-CoA lyase